MDFSELPALLAAFSLGPVSGVTVCLVKNLVNVFFTTTNGVGELCNFLLGACFVLPAGLIYRRVKSRKGAFLAALVGSVVYRFIYAVVFYTKVVPVECLKLLTAVIVALAIAAPGLRRWAAFQKQKHSRKEAA